MTMIGEIVQWCDASALAAALRDSTWLFPFVEAVHLLALALLGGAVLIVDLRVLGIGLKQESAAALLHDARPWLAGSLIVLIVSGGLLFFSEATKCYESPAFRLKMALLAAAVVYSMTVRRWTIGRAASGRLSQAVALGSIALWFGVGITGRGIGFW